MRIGRSNRVLLLARLGGDLDAALRVVALVSGLLCAAMAGTFFLGVYVQRFETLNDFRSRGSDGYPFTWQGALVIALVFVLFATIAALATRTQRSQLVYLAAAFGVACLTLPMPLASFTGWGGWVALVGVVLLALAVIALARRVPLVALAFPVAALAVAVGAVAIAEVREPLRRPYLTYPVPTASAEAPAPPLPPLAYREFVAELRATGATVTEEAGDAIHPFFWIRGRSVRVGVERVSIFEYGTATAAEAEAATISADGRRDERVITSWAEPSHFFRRGSLIVAYIGDAPAVTDLLTRLLGPQFAGQ